MSNARDPVFARSVALVLVACLGAACGPETPEEDTPRALTLVPRRDGRWWLESGDRRYVLDTGTPRTILDPSVLGLPASTYEERLVPVADWRDGDGLHDGATPLLVTAPNATVPLDGVIGMDLLGRHSLTWIPPESLIVGAPGSLPELDRPAVDVPIEIVGGGRTCFGADRCASFGPTRIVFEVRVEDQVILALLDTGSRELGISRRAFARLTDGGRPHRRVAAASGEPLDFSRVAEVEVEGLQVRQLGVRVLEENAAMERLRVETGRPIEALFGTSLLTVFWPTLDASEGRLRLAVDPEVTEHQLSNFGGIGFGGVMEEGCLRVTLLADGLTPQTRGLELGDCVVAFDGHRDPEGIALAMAQAPSAPIGTSMTVTVRRDDAEEDIEVEVERFLPDADEDPAIVLPPL